MPLLMQSLDKAELSAIVAQHFASQLPPGVRFEAEVQFWGQHPEQKKASASSEFKEAILKKYLGKNNAAQEPDLRLLNVGALVILSAPQEQGAAS